MVRYAFLSIIGIILGDMGVRVPPTFWSEGYCTPHFLRAVTAVGRLQCFPGKKTEKTGKGEADMVPPLFEPKVTPMFSMISLRWRTGILKPTAGANVTMRRLTGMRWSCCNWYDWSSTAHDFLEVDQACT